MNEVNMKRKILISAILGWFCIVAAQAQEFSPPQNKNAALRYWGAFAEMKDRSIDDATTKLIEDVLNGRANWDEQKLGAIVEDNADAVRAMQSATALPDCNWGLDYSQGNAMSLAHLPKARVLARLNALYGVRQAASGDTAGAVNTWLAGLRFAQCVEKDISLIGVLSAKPAYLANLHLLAQAVWKGTVSAELQNKIRLQLHQLPAEGLDWTAPIQFETWANTDGLKRLGQSKSFQEIYKEFFGRSPEPSAQPPSAADIANFRAYMKDVLAAFRQPPDQTKERLAALDARLKSMNPAVQIVVPSYQKFNDARRELLAELQSLSSKL
jgi:acyl-CoA-binding protein